MTAPALDLVEGRELRRPQRVDTDVVVVGSGPAGAAVARTVARGGADVVVLEEAAENVRVGTVKTPAM